MSKNATGNGATGTPSSGLVKLTKKDFSSDQDVRWCPGCGDYAILSAVQSVLPDLGGTREDNVFISGIGCSSRFPYYMNTYGFHTIHGRAPAIATGFKVARPDLNVWVVTGDGDGLSIGGNHLMHVLRRNVNLNILLFNNQIYGLTKGQYSPTSELGKKAKSTPMGSIDRPLKPLSVAIGANATFVARAVDTDLKSLKATLKRAAAHKGTSLVEILQNCPVFNDGAFVEYTHRKVKDNHQIVLEHGKPLVFAGGTKGIRMKPDFTPEVVDVGEGGCDLSELVVHDEQSKNPGYAFMLAQLEYPEFPVPMGVFRAIDDIRYDDEANAQVERARAERGRGDLQKLLYSGMTWEVKADGDSTPKN